MQKCGTILRIFVCLLRMVETRKSLVRFALQFRGCLTRLRAEMVLSFVTVFVLTLLRTSPRTARCSRGERECLVGCRRSSAEGVKSFLEVIKFASDDALPEHIVSVPVPRL